MKHKPQPTVRVIEAGRNYIITRTCDGAEAEVLFVARCWRALPPTGLSVDVAGGPNAAEQIVRMVRQWLRMDRWPCLDVHCTGF